MPEQKMIDPGLYQGETIALPPCRFLQFALPDGEKAEAAQQRLHGHHQERREVEGPPPEDADPLPTPPGTQRDGDQAKDVKRDDEDMKSQNRLGQPKFALHVRLLPGHDRGIRPGYDKG